VLEQIAKAPEDRKVAQDGVLLLTPVAEIDHPEHQRRPQEHDQEQPEDRGDHDLIDGLHLHGDVLPGTFYDHGEPADSGPGPAPDARARHPAAGPDRT
jgi:hypothetical protein